MVRVSRYANSIRCGEWVTTHQGIAFNKDGKLVDGQHRLMAIVEADRAIEIMVATDVCDKSVAEMDRNIPRNNAVLLGIHSKHAEIVTFIARLLYGPSPTRCNLQAVKSVTDNAIAKLYAATNTAKKGLSLAPVKSAFVTAYLMSPDESIMENYRKLILMNICDIEELQQTPNAIRALHRRLMNVKEQRGRWLVASQLLGYTLNAIQNTELKQIHCVDIDRILRNIRSFYRNTYSL